MVSYGELLAGQEAHHHISCTGLKTQWELSQCSGKESFNRPRYFTRNNEASKVLRQGSELSDQGFPEQAQGKLFTERNFKLRFEWLLVSCVLILYSQHFWTTFRMPDNSRNSHSNGLSFPFGIRTGDQYRFGPEFFCFFVFCFVKEAVGSGGGARWRPIDLTYEEMGPSLDHCISDHVLHCG